MSEEAIEMMEKDIAEEVASYDTKTLRETKESIEELLDLVNKELAKRDNPT